MRADSGRADTATLQGRVLYTFHEFKSWPGYWIAVLALLWMVLLAQADLITPPWLRVTLRVASLGLGLIVLNRASLITTGRIREYHLRPPHRAAHLWWPFVIAVVALLTVTVLAELG